MSIPNKNTPKDVFLHLFNIFTFYISIIAFITLLIQYINKLFPDALTYYENISNSVTWASSVLLISVPAFILTSWLLEKDIKAMPDKKDFKLRKWLLYFTLFLSAITIVVDLMTLVYNFLQGELTVRFFLKVLVVLLVAGAVFAYYMWDLKRTNIKTNMQKFLATILAIVVLGSVGAGFFIVGTPKEQRNRTFDETRIQNLYTVQSQIISFWQQKQKLPENLNQLNNDILGFYIPTDPETMATYEYSTKTELNFELCANFSTVLTTEEAQNKAKYQSFPYSNSSQSWAHDKGHVCFERTIDPELYKIDNTSTLIPNDMTR